jgi:hypothetical protein
MYGFFLLLLAKLLHHAKAMPCFALKCVTSFSRNTFNFSSLTYFRYLLHGATVLVQLWPPHTLCVVSSQQIFTGWDRQPHDQSSTSRSRVSLLVWHFPRNLSGMGGPTSSYAATSIAFKFIGAHKPPHPATKCFRQGRDTIKGAI